MIMGVYEHLLSGSRASREELEPVYCYYIVADVVVNGSSVQEL